MKKLLSLVLAVVFMLTYTMSAFATPSTLKPSNVTLNIDGKEVTAIHAEAPAPTMVPSDVPAPWNLSYHSHSSSHFQNLLATAIASALAIKFGGEKSAYLTVAINLTGGTSREFTGDDFQDIYYYWQPSDVDPQLPYYIKQYIVHYKDSSYTQYVGTSTRYYYSNMKY